MPSSSGRKQNEWHTGSKCEDIFWSSFMCPSSRMRNEIMYVLPRPTTCALTRVLFWSLPLQWRQNGHDSVSNHQPHDCLLNRLFRLRSKKTSKLRVTGLCAGNSPGTGEFPAQMASYAENVSIWWRHHAPEYSRQRRSEEPIPAVTLFMFL